MKIIETQHGVLDAFDHSLKVIVHQCNCKYSYAGLAKALFDKYSLGDDLNGNKENHSGGDIKIISLRNSNNNTPVYIINMYAQLNPGPSKISNNNSIQVDTPSNRLQYFSDCLTKVGVAAQKADIRHIGVPHNIGCGLGGGIWKEYELILSRFETMYGIEVILFKVKV